MLNNVKKPKIQIPERGSIMKAEVVNPFYIAAKEILEIETDVKCERGKLSLASSKWTTQEITIIINVIGQVRGAFIIGMSSATGKLTAEKMICEKVETINELVVSCLAELGNIIAGRALSKLETVGYLADITPPMFLYGEKAYISTLNRQRIQIPLNTEIGVIELSIALEIKS